VCFGLDGGDKHELTNIANMSLTSDGILALHGLPSKSGATASTYHQADTEDSY
jgi:hypothetical protein